MAGSREAGRSTLYFCWKSNLFVVIAELEHYHVAICIWVELTRMNNNGNRNRTWQHLHMLIINVGDGATQSVKYWNIGQSVNDQMAKTKWKEWKFTVRCLNLNFFLSLNYWKSVFQPHSILKGTKNLSSELTTNQCERCARTALLCF